MTNEVALPYRSRTNQTWTWGFSGPTHPSVHASRRLQWLLVQQRGRPLVWDNPLVLTIRPRRTGRARCPGTSNSLQTLSAARLDEVRRRTQLTARSPFGWANNDEPLLPFTDQQALPQFRCRARQQTLQPRRLPPTIGCRLPPGATCVHHQVPPLRLQQRMPDTPIWPVISLRHVGR